MTTSVAAKIGFDRILVPTDFTDVSQRAVDYARCIARLYDSSLVLAHVTLPLSPVTPPEMVWFDELTVQQQEEQQLEDRGAELRSEGFHASTASLTGVVQEELFSAAEREDSDLIVIGTHGRAGMQRLLFGSEAEPLYRRAHRPILVVGPGAKPVQVNAQNEVQPWHPQEIIYSCNLDPATAPTAAFAYRLAQEHKATFTILHVEDSEKHIDHEKHFQEFKAALAALLAPDEKPVYIRRALLMGYNLGATIADFARERHADLVIMGAHSARRSTTHLPRGIAAQVITKAPSPVLVLHHQ